MTVLHSVHFIKTGRIKRRSGVYEWMREKNKVAEGQIMQELGQELRPPLSPVSVLVESELEGIQCKRCRHQAPLGQWRIKL